LLASEADYAKVAKGRKILVAKSLNLPQTNYWFAFIVVERTEGQENWSPDKADRTVGKIFVYDIVSKRIESKLTDCVNAQLGADKYYESNFCGGLGSLDENDYKIVGDKIVITQFYAPAIERSNCATEIAFRNGQVVVQKVGKEDTGLGVSTGKERKLLNQKALELLKAGKTNEAIAIWEICMGSGGMVLSPTQSCLSKLSRCVSRHEKEKRGNHSLSAVYSFGSYRTAKSL
jgi:hypothetical protein